MRRKLDRIQIDHRNSHGDFFDYGHAFNSRVSDFVEVDGMISMEHKHETRNNPLESCVDDLAVGLGMWIGSTAVVTEMQAGCFIYSVLKLARIAGVPRDRAIQPFDTFRKLAIQIWDTELEVESDHES